MSTLRGSVLKLMAGAGIMAASRALSAAGLRILCYHGFSLVDEHRFRPKLFMRGERLADRLAWLRKHGYTIIPLDEAVKQLAAGKLGRRQVVLTIDDGFYSVLKVAAPILREFDCPSTLYMTTYYMNHQAPIFRLLVQYIRWRAAPNQIPLEGIADGIDGVSERAHEPESAPLWKLIRWGETSTDEDGRQRICSELAQRAGVDLAEVLEDRRLGLLRPDEVASLGDFGIDVQLHTHRHVLPVDGDGARREIDDNRRALAAFVSGPLSHFCYPSGQWSRDHWSALGDAGIVSATTCDAGLNWASTPALALRRLLDADDLQDEEFVAEFSGLKSALRRVYAAGS